MTPAGSKSTSKRSSRPAKPTPERPLPAPLVAFARRELLAWYRRDHRDLPWRRSGDPYRIWLSETMLQQTRVETVLPYYDRFVSRFPTVFHLADADEEEVLQLWAGLGYYARARNLKRAAETIARDHAGELPCSAEALRALPGVGPYTAGAVASIAFGERAAVVDGNVKRVLSRLLGEHALGTAALWRVAEALVPPRAAGDFNQAVMELGARVCTPRSPRCNDCPLRPRCAAHASGSPEAYPARVRRPAPKPVAALAGALVRTRPEPALLVVRRPSHGLLGGLWELPSAEGGAPAALEKSLLQTLGLETRVGEPLGQVRHVFSHRTLTLDVVRLERIGGRLRQPSEGAARFCALPALAELPLSTLAKKSLALVRA